MTLSRTYISATTGRPFHAPELSFADKQKYGQLMGRLQVAARAYDGTQYRRIALLVIASDIAEMAGGSPDLIDAYARQAVPGNNAVFNLDDVYLKARQRLRGSKEQESAYGTLLKTFKDYGTKPNKQPQHVVEAPHPGGTSGYQPRLATLIDMLCDAGIGIERLTITTGPYTLPQQLRGSYILLSNKESGLQIAVSDDESLPTFIVRNADQPEFWNARGTKSVRSYNYDSFVEQARAALGLDAAKAPDLHALSSVLLAQDSTMAEIDKVDKDMPVKRRVVAVGAAEPVTVTKPAGDLSLLAFSWAALPEEPDAPAQQEELATVTTAMTKAHAPAHADDKAQARHESVEGRMERIAQDIIHHALTHKAWPTGQSQNDTPETRKKWLAHGQWLYQNGRLSLGRCIDNLVYNLAQLHKNRTGALPTCHSGDIAEAPGLSWSLVDDCYRAKIRRTETLAIALQRQEPGHEQRVMAERAQRRAAPQP